MPFSQRSRLATRLVPRLALGVAVAAAAIAAPAGADPHLTRVSGSVEIGRGEPPTWQAAAEGDVLGAGDTVRTGRDGRAEVDLGTGTVRLYEHSLLRLPPDAMRLEGAAATELGRGGALFDVKPRSPKDPFEVRTPEVVASVKGTRFGVEAIEHRAAVSVYAGMVGVRALAAPREAEVMVRPGFLAAGSRDGRPELELLRHDDPWDSWQQGAPAPPPPQALHVPASPEGGTPAAVADVDEARDAARRAAAPEVLEAVAQRDPEVARRRDAAKAEKPGAGAASIDGELADEILKGGAAAAHEVTTPADTRTPIDGAAAEKADAAKPELEGRVAESLLNGTAPSVAGTSGGTVGSLSSLGLKYEIGTENGSNVVEISSATGEIGTLTKTQLESIATTGSTSGLSPALLSVLQSNGVSPTTFAQTLLKVAY